MNLKNFLEKNIKHNYLLDEWNQENGNIENFLSSDKKHTTWLCPKVKHHRWTSSIKNRIDRKIVCKICANKEICKVDGCNSLYYKYPNLRCEWNKKKNGNMKEYFPCTGKTVSWICSNDSHHQWEAKISNRSKSGKGCPICKNIKICPVDQCNSVYYSNPELRCEWNTEKNGNMKNYFKGYDKNVGWICKHDNHHIWDSSIDNRAGKKKGCPICKNVIICPIDMCNSVYYSNPELKCEWDTNKNGSMKNYFKGSNFKVGWICETCKNEWNAPISNRTNKYLFTGCPKCGQESCATKLSKTNEIFIEDAIKIHSDKYDYAKVEYINGKTKVTIICKIHGEFQQRPNDHLAKMSGCPSCASTRSELTCKSIFEQIFNEPFLKTRLKILNKYELDGYSKKLRIAFEYSGMQHYKYIPHFHRNGEIDFEKQKQRDFLKKKLCVENNITLIEIPYSYNYRNRNKMEQFIISELKRLEIKID